MHSAHHQDCHHILAMEYYSAYHLWHPLQDLLHPNTRQKSVSVTTVYSVPDDGCKGHPKHVELLTPNKEHKKLHLVGIYMISKSGFLSIFSCSTCFMMLTIEIVLVLYTTCIQNFQWEFCSPFWIHVNTVYVWQYGLTANFYYQHINKVVTCLDSLGILIERHRHKDNNSLHPQNQQTCGWMPVNTSEKTTKEGFKLINLSSTLM